MSAKPNYFTIGLFIIVSFILILAAVVVFGSGLFVQEKIYFETYFDTPVSGLDVGAPIEDRGVRVGQVEKITFARNVYEMPVGSEDYYKYANHVIVLVAINQENTPQATWEEKLKYFKEFVSRGFRVRLASNLLTGQAYLEGDYLDPNRFPAIEVPWEPKHLYVPSVPGEFTTLKQSVDSILVRLEKIDTEKIGDLIEELLVSVNKAVDETNVPAISSGIQSFIANADQAIKDINMPAISNEVRSLFAEARQTNQYLQELLNRPEKTDSQMANIAVMVANLNRTLLRIDRLVSSQAPQIDQALENLRDVSADLKDLTGSLKRHPSQLISSQPPRQSEASK